jgi:hypothetical protein
MRAFQMNTPDDMSNGINHLPGTLPASWQKTQARSPLNITTTALRGRLFNVQFPEFSGLDRWHRRP